MFTQPLIPALTAAGLAGLVGSPHCIGMCGSFALACGGRVSHTLAWNAGRTTTYAILGGLAGFAGASVPGPSWVATVISAALVIWFAAALAGFAPDPTLRIPGLARLATRAAEHGDLPSRFLFGMANGLLPCGLVYATLGIAVASGQAATGAAAMVVFGLGTTPALAIVALSVRRLTAERLWMRRTAAVLVLGAGLWMVAQRHARAGRMGHGAEADPAAAPAHVDSPVP